MDWRRMADRAKQVIDKRGGSQSVKEDAEELLDIAKNRDSTSDKFKEAVEAIREPGAGHEPGGEPHEPGGQPHEPGGEPHEPGGQPHEPGGEPHETAKNPPETAPDDPPQKGGAG